MKERRIKTAARVGAQASGREQKRGRAPRFARSRSDSTTDAEFMQLHEDRIMRFLYQCIVAGIQKLYTSEISVKLLIPEIEVKQALRYGCLFSIGGALYLVCLDQPDGQGW